jgi:hemerythrin-like domain-containing protein
MKVTEQLEEEHAVIKSMLEVLEEICKRLEAGGDVDIKHLDHVVEFIQVFADKCHHGKEEGLLFPAMEKAGIPKEGGALGVMLAEHGDGRNYALKMKEAVAEYKAQGAEAALKFIENARNYIGLLSRHIDKEDNVLYPMADEALSKNKQKELFEEFERIEIDRIGSGTHERFHILLDYLRAAYLK